MCVKLCVYTEYDRKDFLNISKWIPWYRFLQSTTLFRFKLLKTQNLKSNNFYFYISGHNEMILCRVTFDNFVMGHIDACILFFKYAVWY